MPQIPFPLLSDDPETLRQQVYELLRIIYEDRIGGQTQNDVSIGDDASYLTWDGTTLSVSGGITPTSGSVIDGAYLEDNSVASASANLSMRGWTFSGTFSSTDADTVSWTSGTFTASDGTAYTITSGNTGNMTAQTYIYLDIAISTTALQTTTTASTAIGNGKVLIAVAKNQTTKATLQVFGGSGGVTILVDNLVANATATNEFVSNTAQIANAIITNAKIADLAVSKLTTGTITSKEITLAVTDNTGDSKIQAGKTDFTNTENGFILGIDDSDANKAKLYIGDSTYYLNWDGSALTVKGKVYGISDETLPLATPLYTGYYSTNTSAGDSAYTTANATDWTITGQAIVIPQNTNVKTRICITFRSYYETGDGNVGVITIDEQVNGTGSWVNRGTVYPNTAYTLYTTEWESSNTSVPNIRIVYTAPAEPVLTTHINTRTAYYRLAYNKVMIPWN